MSRSSVIHRRKSGLLVYDNFQRSTESVIDFYDSFDRSDGAIGSPWTDRIGTWLIDSNRAAPATLSGGEAVTTVDLGTGDTTILAYYAGIAANARKGLVFRLSDASNFWYVAAGASPVTPVVVKVVAGVPTTVWTGGSSSLFDFPSFCVQMYGSDIKIYFGVAGSAQWQLYTTITDSFNSTATHFGLYGTSVTSNQQRMNDFYALENPAHPVGGGDTGGSLGTTEEAGALGPLPWHQWSGDVYNGIQGFGWGIDANGINTPSAAWTPQTAIATVDAGTPNVRMRTRCVVRGNQCALIFRWIDRSNYWYWFSWSTSPQGFVRKVVAGVDTLVAGNVFGTYGFFNGEIIEVACEGNYIAGYKDGTLRWSTTDSDNNTGTEFGLQTSNESPSSHGGDISVRFNAFSLLDTA